MGASLRQANDFARSRCIRLNEAQGSNQQSASPTPGRFDLPGHLSGEMVAASGLEPLTPAL